MNPGTLEVFARQVVKVEYSRKNPLFSRKGGFFFTFGGISTQNPIILLEDMVN
jgi:hypothetical protein